MSDLEVALRRSVDDLSSMGRAFALVGGLAVSARAEPRLTRDVDLAVAVADDAEAEEVVRALRVCGYSVVSALEQETTGRLASVRLRSDTEGRGVIVDLLFASSGIEAEVAGDAERLEVLPGFVVPVARIGHLVAMKLLARDDRGRPADADDLAALAACATEDDWRVAEEAVGLIDRRGTARGRDLHELLARLRDGENG